MINTFVTKKYEELIKHAASCVLLHFFIDKNEVDVEIGFLSKNDIRELNLISRDVNEPTDVLSFPSINYLEYTTKISVDLFKNGLIEKFKKSAFASINPENNALILGEIYICLEVAKEQVKKYGHSIERELSFLTVHGMLHLLGYDHIASEDRIGMEAIQDDIMNVIGYQR